MKTATKWFLGITAVGAVGVLAWAKTSSSVNFVKNLTFEPLWYGGILDMNISTSGVKLPLAVDLGNRSDQTFKVRINAVDVYSNGKKAASSTAKLSEVVINPYSTSRLKLDVVVSWSYLKDLGVSLINASESLEKIMDSFAGMEMRIDFTINNSVQTPLRIDFENGEVKMDGLGLVPTSNRHKVGNFRDYAGYIPSQSVLKKKDEIVIEDVEPEDTARTVRRWAKKYSWQTLRLADRLRGRDDFETVRNVFNFVYSYIAYMPDSTQSEDLRIPLRTLYDQAGDCDCMTLLVCSLFENLGIRYTIRIAEYDNKGYFQHIYAIANISSGDVTCDPVVEMFNYEKPFTNKKDF